MQRQMVRRWFFLDARVVLILRQAKPNVKNLKGLLENFSLY
jgi:hypothetical protein